MAGTSGLTYGIDIANRSQLINGLNSQRVFFDDDYGLNELEASESPLLTMLLSTNKKKASGEYESYIEHRGSWITETRYYVQASTTTAISALEASAAVYEGLKISLTAAGAAVTTNTMQVGDVFVLVDPTDETLFASGLVISTSAGEMTWRLLTRTPGFDIVANAAGATYLYHVSRAFGENSAESEERYELPTTCWNEIGDFKESFEISDVLLANKQIEYGSELLFQNKHARMRMMKLVDLGLLYAHRRANLSTAANPYSSPGSTPVTNAAGQRVMTTMSLDQAIRAADTVGIGGSRLYKLTASTMTPDDMDAVVASLTEYGSPNKKIFAGAGAIQALITMSRKNNQYQMTSGDTAFGLKWNKYITPDAEFDIIKHRGLKNHFNNAMFVVDPQYLSLRQLIPLYTEPLVANTTGKKWELRWNIGLRVKFPEAHGLIYFT